MRRASRRVSSVHPRSCGKYLLMPCVTASTAGSSPLVREILFDLLAGVEQLRFIPARAGNTSRRPRRSPASSVHPRSCGKYHLMGKDRVRHVGSSPLVREIRVVGAGVALGRRFIPARAGNTSWPRTPTTRCTVHPRSCGKYVHGVQRLRQELRFIPARAGNTGRLAGLAMLRAVHPRSCGKYGGGEGGERQVRGSSPLVREIRRHSGAATRPARFIPARAGNTRCWRSRARPRAVHPRSCGKYICEASGSARVTGSSPLVREIPLLADALYPSGRFIPARAGNTRPDSTSCLTRCGSSPLVREIPRRRRGSGERGRFIPARAGNTLAWSAMVVSSPVHPRSCGKYLAASRAALKLAGSSPLVREILGHQPAAAAVLRFIPARAGNTRRCRWRAPAGPVHPRSCGKYLRSSGSAEISTGSSPLVQEIPQTLRHPPARRLFIPARAGNTGATLRTLAAKAVHPRSCGKYALPFFGGHPWSGSSPLVREIPPATRGRRPRWRFIPARAGNTVLSRCSGKPGAVHPRSCGKYAAFEAWCDANGGSSPLVREIPSPN